MAYTSENELVTKCHMDRIANFAKDLDAFDHEISYHSTHIYT